jgi:Reverse transcriptase (RNA-dependent DNA polymerase)
MKVIHVHCIYSAKVDSEGNVLRYKARLVAEGCRQIPRVDVDEVFAPTSSFGARRAILYKAAREDLEVHQLDIKTAFLNGDLEEEVYVTQLPGFHNGDDGLVYRLNKALYGLKQAPRAWHKTLSASLRKFGFHPCHLMLVCMSARTKVPHLYICSRMWMIS